MSSIRSNVLVGFVVVAIGCPVFAQDEPGQADLAQELTNPIADLITVPIQFNLDQDIGPTDDGTKMTLNIQPVIPVGLGEDWNLITRTIVPLVYQDDVVPGAGSKTGLGDVLLSLFFSPMESTIPDLTWGVGPVALLPTATSAQLGADKWAVGPGVVGVAMKGPWTMGMLANHIWSVAGDSDRADLNNTFLQPFVAYTTPGSWTYSFQTETTYNWEAEQWSVPVNAAVSKLVKIGPLPVSLQAGGGYWLDSPDAQVPRDSASVSRPTWCCPRGERNGNLHQITQNHIYHEGSEPCILKRPTQKENS